MKLRYAIILPGGQRTYCRDGIELDNQIKWLLEHHVSLDEVVIKVAVND